MERRPHLREDTTDDTKDCLRVRHFEGMGRWLLHVNRRLRSDTMGRESREPINHTTV